MQQGGIVEVVDVPTAGALVVQQLIEYADKQIERRMLGQSMSSGESGREGLGGTVGPALMAMTTKHLLLLADAEELEETLTGSEAEPGLCYVIQKYTYPGTIDQFRVRWRFMVDDPDPLTKIRAITELAAAGVEMGQDSARQITGEPAPKEGEKTFGGAKAAPAPGSAPVPGAKAPPAAASNGKAPHPADEDVLGGEDSE
jgi:phage gp29-like protein